uniref:Structural maintenance of chromosomes protein 4-like isoform X2 n=1 Tax=Crassostrea virginica TaxID=6565 RepID=A0A8B8AY36_CRAVI|nr:structural maintenance of chromosomes protein 4-like isoform X2 [Crassostrea virginica]
MPLNHNNKFAAMGRRNQRKCVEDIDFLIQKMKKATKLQPLTDERKDLLLARAHRFVNQWNREKEVIRLLCQADNTYEQMVDEYVIVFEAELGKKPEREMVARFLFGSEINRINTGPDELHQQKMAVCMTELQDEVQRKKDLFAARERQSYLMKNVLEELQEKARESMQREIQKLERIKKENEEIMKRRKIMETVFVELQSEVKRKQEFIGARERQALLMKNILEENEVQLKQQIVRAKERQTLLMKNVLEEVKNEVQRKQQIVRAKERQVLLMKNTIKELKNEVHRKQEFDFTRQRQTLLKKNVHQELKSLYQRKREFMEPFVPRKLFFMSIDFMKEMQKNDIKTANVVSETHNEQTTRSTTGKETKSITEETLEKKPARVRRSWRQRIARFLRCF